MIEIIGTLREDLTNHVIHRTENKEQVAKQLEELRANCSEYVRFYARPEIPLIKLKFYEVEQQVIVYALKQFDVHNIPVDPSTFVLCATNLLIDMHEKNYIPWLDVDTLGDTLSKMKKLTPEEVKEIIHQCRSNVT